MTKNEYRPKKPTMIEFCLRNKGKTEMPRKNKEPNTMTSTESRQTIIKAKIESLQTETKSNNESRPELRKQEKLKKVSKIARRILHLCRYRQDSLV